MFSFGHNEYANSICKGRPRTSNVVSRPLLEFALQGTLNPESGLAIDLSRDYRCNSTTHRIYYAASRTPRAQAGINTISYDLQDELL